MNLCLFSVRVIASLIIHCKDDMKWVFPAKFCPMLPQKQHCKKFNAFFVSSVWALDTIHDSKMNIIESLFSVNLQFSRGAKHIFYFFLVVIIIWFSFWWLYKGWIENLKEEELISIWKNWGLLSRGWPWWCKCRIWIGGSLL